MLIAEEDLGYPILSREIERMRERERERERERDRELGFRELKEGEKGRTEEKKSQNSQNSHKFAHNEPHTGVCDSLCKFENVLFSKENRTHKSLVFAQCKQNNHAYLIHCLI